MVIYVHVVPYDRQAATAYAKEWALKRNPAYYNFDGLGGDCTNFTSQCLYAGSKVMNHTKVYGWYYYNLNHRTASWTGVPYLYNFLLGNKGTGPFAVETDRFHVQRGDILQLGTHNGNFYHSPVIVAVYDNEIFVAAHTDDAYMRPLSTYVYDQVRFLSVLGVRKY